MAATPSRAKNTENALIGKRWNFQSFEEAKSILLHDFTPMSDARASAQYRAETAQNMLLRYFIELENKETNILKVRP